MGFNANDYLAKIRQDAKEEEVNLIVRQVIFWFLRDLKEKGSEQNVDELYESFCRMMEEEGVEIK